MVHVENNRRTSPAPRERGRHTAPKATLGSPGFAEYRSPWATQRRPFGAKTVPMVYERPDAQEPLRGRDALATRGRDARATFMEANP